MKPERLSSGRSYNPPKMLSGELEARVVARDEEIIKEHDLVSELENK